MFLRRSTLAVGVLTDKPALQASYHDQPGEYTLIKKAPSLKPSAGGDVAT